MAAALVPPPQFRDASFDSYRPDSEYESQAQAVDLVRDFITAKAPAKSSGFFSRKPKVAPAKPGIYLDGGFGVGKTHLLAAAWHQAHGRKYFGTFIEYTALVGALGYQGAVELLRGASLIAIDEFELDDPGDTMMMTRLLSELVSSGTRLAATSNTPPNALGEGRFAAVDFLREIQALSDRFETIRIDGLDYRRRDFAGHAKNYEAEELELELATRADNGAAVTLDSFDELMHHLSTIHPSRYVRLIDSVNTIGLSGVHELHSQTDALRFVAFIDRVYDAQTALVASGTPLDMVFAGDMMLGGYRKKYLRAVSRLVASSQR